TGLGGGRRVSKDSARVRAYGTVDELNSAIGVALALGLSDRLAAELPRIQNELFDLGSDLCWPSDDERPARPSCTSPGRSAGGQSARRSRSATTSRSVTSSRPT